MTLSAILLIVIYTWMASGCVFALVHRKGLAKTIDEISPNMWWTLLAVCYVVPISMIAPLFWSIDKLVHGGKK